MRLTDEQIKVTLSELDKMKLHTIVEEGLKLMLKDFAETIEAQQQEIERQKERCNGYMVDYGTAIELMAEKTEQIQQLQAQNGAMREALTKARKLLISAHKRIKEQLHYYVTEPKKFKYSKISVVCSGEIWKAIKQIDKAGGGDSD